MLFISLLCIFYWEKKRWGCYPTWQQMGAGTVLSLFFLLSCICWKPNKSIGEEEEEEGAAMASSLPDLELLMTHNLRLSREALARRRQTGPRSPAIARTEERVFTEKNPVPPPREEEQQEEIDRRRNNPSFPGFSCLSASISLSMASLLPSVPLLPPPSQPRAGPPPLPLSAKESFGSAPVSASLKILANDVSLPGPLPAGAKQPSKTRMTAFPDYHGLPAGRPGSRQPSGGAALRRASLLWFRSDLRLHDNEALSAANKESLSVLPVYCFDPRDYGKSTSGFDKTGPYRAQFLLECVSNLRETLRQRGSDLIVRYGKPEEVLVSLAKSIGADALYAHQEVSHDEVTSEMKVASSLKDEGVDVKFFWGSTLFHIDDLPFKPDKTPTTYGGFREQVQKLEVRKAIENPEQLKGVPSRGEVEPGNLPTLKELGLKPSVSQLQDGKNANGMAIVGGETVALKRLQNFTAEYFKEVNGKAQKEGGNLFAAGFSCKISPWLATGCLSPRRIFNDLKSGQRVSASGASKEDGLNWLMFELLWRDFFRFITKKYSLKQNDAEVATGCSAGLVPA